MGSQGSTQLSIGGNIIVQGIYQQNMPHGHNIYFTELVILRYLTLSHRPAFTHTVPPAWNTPVSHFLSTLKPVISYSFSSSQFRCTFSKKPSLTPQMDEMSLLTQAPTAPLAYPYHSTQTITIYFIIDQYRLSVRALREGAGPIPF